MVRALGTLTSALVLLCMGVGVPFFVFAENFKPKVSELQSFEDFLFGVNEVRENISGVQCGGWNDTGAGVSGGNIPIPTIDGVPGRESDPLGAPETGLGTRESFRYPEGAQGGLSACNIYTSHVNPEQLCIKNSNKATPQQCVRLYDRLTQELPAMTDPQLEALGFCKNADGNYCFQYTSICDGQACADHEGPPVFSCGGEVTIPASFFRYYNTTVTTPDGQSWNFGSACYEYYYADDPAQTVTSYDREQCEFDVAPNHPSPEWNDGSGTQKGEVAPNPTVIEEEPQDSRDNPEPWKSDSDTNLAIPDYDTWAQEMQSNGGVPRLSDLLALPVESKTRASKTSPPFSKTDSFDDTTERDFSSFWEEEQRELLKINQDPQVSVMLPALYLHNLSFDDPIFNAVGRKTELPSGLVQVTLRAGLEDLGHVLQSFQESRIVRLDEVRIPILVPVAGDIDARIGQWRQWKELEERSASEAGRPSYAGEADANIEKLEEYKERVDKVRELRGSLVLYTQRLLDHTREVRERMAEEFRQRSEEILQVQQQSEARKEVRRIWRLIERSLQLADECQILWCSNHRYSSPIYSLLDEWWGEEPPGGNRNLGYEPESIRDIAVPETEDYLFDFSSFSFSGSTITVPIFGPVQVRLELPLPPLVGTQPEPIDSYPDLPPLPPDTEFLSQPLPPIDIAPLVPITPPPQPDLEPVKEILRDFRKIVDGTPIDWQILQEEYIAGGGSMDLLPEINFSRDNLLGAMCRFPYSVTIPRISQTTSDPLRIVHVENDMKERLSRLFSRWMPNRTEDFDGRIRRLQVDPPTETGCNEGLLCLVLPALQKMETDFAWFVPTVSVDANVLIDTMRDRTLPPSNDENPYLFAPNNILRRIFPEVKIPNRPTLSTYE